ncbi:MAG: methyltransferase domain-containing protein [Desulfobulbaceae bacterium]|nr:methyltransferase domain-containing protein [Desulfobulbaceae bacterium]
MQQPWKTLLQQAQTHAQSGRFPEMLVTCRQIIESHGDKVDALLDVGSLLLSFGFLTHARECFDRIRELAPDDLRSVVNLGNLTRDAGHHATSRELYASLLERLPNNPVIRRNVLVSLEYDPEVSDHDRLSQARSWGEWAIAQAGGPRPRPPLLPLDDRPLKIGYLSPDFCQHTVGLLVKDVIASHDRDHFIPYAYSAGNVRDWVSKTIQKQCQFRDVSQLNDTRTADIIRQDNIDILVDLSGHTAGSRLTVFAHRPAPLLVSWLGYFATTGLSVMDAVLLDQWHAPEWMDEQFIEPIVRLACGRFCYTPVPFAPEVTPLPAKTKNFITFGSFNNTSKYNDSVYKLWSEILNKVENSRLILKWRNFNDEVLQKTTFNKFAGFGIDPKRIELRPASFHVDLLKEYGDIDIALDPFPFTGGMTSCEALWMGVPVVSWPQSRVVSRQTFAFLSAIGLHELAAKDANDYARIAVELADDYKRLERLRSGMRTQMQASSLMDVRAFTRQLEQALIDQYNNIRTQEESIPMPSKTILHIGPGHRKNGAKLPVAFQTPVWRETRLDIDPANEPDIVGSMLDMATVADTSVDAVYSAHNIEHVYAHEVPVVLGEFLRVLDPDGFAVITCPDLQAVCALVAEDKLTDAAYQSPAGPITPLDILYGHGAALAAGRHYMAHKCGFTLKSLTAALQSAGFKTIAGKRRARGLDLWVVASKGPMGEAEIRELAGKVLPG